MPERVFNSNYPEEPIRIDEKQIIAISGTTYDGLSALGLERSLSGRIDEAKAAGERLIVVVDMSGATDFGYLYHRALKRASEACRGLGGGLYITDPSEEVTNSIDWRFIPEGIDAKPYQFDVLTSDLAN